MLAAVPNEILWTASDGPRLTTLVGYDGWMGPFARGFGALGATYQLRRSSSLSAPDWQQVGDAFEVESTGEFRQFIPMFEEQHFYRVEELP
ncbi:MAG: hypothetical protein KF791_09960 [Verrucomicrobiae bacterium]|nr:hypothetical protein [Verrucomicrobiae bacterium]